MIDPFEGLARITKPGAPELDKRNRESGLLGGIKVHFEEPDPSILTEGYSYVSFASGTPVLKVYFGGVLYETALADPTATPPGLPPPDYDSGFLSISASSSRDYPHGLGVRPKLVVGFLDFTGGDHSPLPYESGGTFKIYIWYVNSTVVHVINNNTFTESVCIYAWKGAG